MSERQSDRPTSGPEPGGPHDPAPRWHLPLFKVILHQDAMEDLMYVVRTVMELTHYCKAEATHKMWQAYHCGRSLLLTTHRERAELYVEQFASKGLVVSIEPA
jgi:ATP-dependent Clp protease adapter protein ClpS